MRLIDADALDKEILGYAFEGKYAGCTIGDFIDNQPTAYDVEAVVAELEEMRQGCRLNAEVYTARKIEKAISIVRGKE